MTEEHQNDITTDLHNFVQTITTWFGKRARALPVINLVQRGLFDLNRLADAAEKLAGFEFANVGDLGIGTTDVLKSMTGATEAWITDEERKTLDALRDGTAKIVLTAADDTAAIRAGVDGLASRAGDLERLAVSDYAAWLTTRPGVLKAGAGYEAPLVFATVEEYAKIKGWA